MPTEGIAPAPASGERQDLLERGDELVRIAAAARAAAVAGAGGAIVVEGPAGIGKTALLRAARSRARESGLAVLAARGAPLEREFAFGVARQALEPAVAALDGAAAAVFAGPARLSAPLLGSDAVEVSPAALPTGPDAAFSVVHALGALVANLARRRPLALLVDDAHWADAPSLRLLAFLAARASELPLLLIVATRPAGEPHAAAAGRMLTDGIPAAVLRPRPLSADAAARLVRVTLPGAGVELCEACHRAAGGNPFYLHELAGALAEAGIARAADVDRVVPDGVAAAVGARLARLSGQQRLICRAVAVLGEEVPLRRAAAVAELDARVASQAADELRVAGILTPGRPLGFVHPLLRTAVESSMPAGELAAAHARAARLLWADGETDERIAGHLLAAEPAASAWACDRLLLAAEEALLRGAPEAAIAHLSRALAEPPPPERRAEVLIELGSAEVLALQWSAGGAHLRAGMAATEDPGRRLRAALMLSGMLGSAGRADEAVALLDEALRRGDGAEPSFVARLEGHLVNVGRLRIDTYPRVRAWSARVRRRIEGGAEASPAELAAVCADMVMAGEPAGPAVALARRALRATPPLPSLPGDFSALHIVRCLVAADRFDLAEPALDALVDAAQRHGAAFYASAEGVPGRRAPASRRARARARGGAGRSGDVRRGLGDRRAGRAARHRQRLRRPRGPSPGARSLVEDEVARARTFGAPRAIGIALRASGLVAGGRRGLDLLAEAAAVLERSGARLEHARALADLGAALRRAGDALGARERLAVALETAHECGARALEQRALRELRATGARPRRPMRHGALALTPGERRVAEMAARGLTNRDIADALVVTTRTVEFHLSAAYRKLEIHSRDDLAEALGDRP